MQERRERWGQECWVLFLWLHPVHQTHSSQRIFLSRVKSVSTILPKLLYMAVASWLLGEPCVSGPGECLMCDMDLRKLQALGLQTFLFYAFTKQPVKREASEAKSATWQTAYILRQFLNIQIHYGNSSLFPGMLCPYGLQSTCSVSPYQILSPPLLLPRSFLQRQEFNTAEFSPTRQEMGNLCSLSPALLGGWIPGGAVPADVTTGWVSPADSTLAPGLLLEICLSDEADIHTWRGQQVSPHNCRNQRGKQ